VALIVRRVWGMIGNRSRAEQRLHGRTGRRPAPRLLKKQPGCFASRVLRERGLASASRSTITVARPQPVNGYPIPTAICFRFLTGAAGGASQIPSDGDGCLTVHV